MERSAWDQETEDAQLELQRHMNTRTVAVVELMQMINELRQFKVKAEADIERLKRALAKHPEHRPTVVPQCGPTVRGGGVVRQGDPTRAGLLPDVAPEDLESDGADAEEQRFHQMAAAHAAGGLNFD
jgi:hypothetical protein